PDVAAVRVEVAKAHGLKLDRVLRPVRELRAEAVLARPRGQRLDEVAVDLRGPQRAFVVLARQRPGMRHPGVAGAEEHEQVRDASLRDVAIGPRVRPAAAVEVDVGRDAGPPPGALRPGSGAL